MELKFLIGRDGRNIKREHSRRACTQCRQKKKRCLHTTSDLVEQTTYIRQGQAPTENDFESSPQPIIVLDSPTSYVREQVITPSPGEIETQRPLLPTRPAAVEPREDIDGKGLEPHPFVCDTNPVLHLLENPESRLERGRGEVGAWLPDERITSQPRSSLTFVEKGQSRSTGNVGLLPPKPSQEALVDLYFRRIHPILPLLNEVQTRSEFLDSTISLPLLQSICLIASKDRRAVPFLYLDSDRTLLPLERFGELMYDDIMRSMPRREERKRVLTIQILALISLHEWGPNGSEDCSLNLAQAVHHAQIIGLHLARPGKEWDIHMKSLFWCLWSLDRWSAAVNGRAIILHDCDIGQDVTDIIQVFQPPFRLWLLLAHQLGEVIKSYRPMVRGACDQDLELPTFEEVVERSNAWNVSTEVLSSLELYHHAIVILSTHSKGLQGRSHSRMSKIRQSHSTLAIAALSRKTRMDNLLPISISAYTLSLALSITYIHFKEAKLPSAQVVAKDNFEFFYECLTAFRKTWWLAAVMMKLGRQGLDGMQQRLAQEQSDRSVYHTAWSNAESAAQPPLVSQGASETDGTTSIYSGGSQNIQESYSDRNTSYPSDFGNSLGNPALPSTGEDFFDVFLENFADVNFPTVSGDQFFWDSNLLPGDWSALSAS
ncbi:hypothetical protein BDV23DRAFT_164476 [Aspergillus alliaceus]|uniref:Xylanolytic transcriptional activator regulatory domain-containing protein n=1 Tax=Petromyces alliaceus TaxID=209559 RepID=A0A5N7BV77_PETAA|nr:hypothetical protein BDV23DRAFT_164476 [Aspergillus alliaceus]